MEQRRSAAAMASNSLDEGRRVTWKELTGWGGAGKYDCFSVLVAADEEVVRKQIFH